MSIMDSDRFLHNLFRNLWEHIIEYEAYVKLYNSAKTITDILEPEEFFPTAVSNLLSKLDKSGRFYEDYIKFAPSISPETRPVVVDFMAWYKNLTDDSIQDRYRYLEEVARSGISELDNIVDFVKTQQIPDKPSANEISSSSEAKLQIIRDVLDHFTSASISLRERRPHKVSIVIHDEYDVQDILYAILKPHFPTIRREEVVPGNTDKRFLKLDFMLSGIKIGIECKCIRDGAHASKLSVELNDDIQTYHKHQDCRYLIFFIYDPKLAIDNPEVLIESYNGTQAFNGKLLRIQIVIRPIN